jgi:hypothetical protein
VELFTAAAITDRADGDGVDLVDAVLIVVVGSDIR